MLIKNAEIQGQLVDVRFNTHITELGKGLLPDREPVFDAQGCAVLPGLHDHHIHLYASAQAAHSIDCSGMNEQILAQALMQLPGKGWIRAVNYHEQTAGNLDRYSLDRWCTHRPLRVQHASGKLWVLNSLAVDALKLGREDMPGIECDDKGVPNGRLWRMDSWLQTNLGGEIPNLTYLSQELASYGITGVTDASYTNTLATQRRLECAWRAGELLQKPWVMGDESIELAPLKIMLDEDDLPDIYTLVDRVGAAHVKRRGVAFHCVSHVELVFALAVLQQAGADHRDRIEHAGVVRPECLLDLASTGATVVTQPGFLWSKGERYRAQADAHDIAYLYPYASLLAVGVPVGLSSDAPYGPLDPWRVMSTAVARRTEQGGVLVEAECVTPNEALRGYLGAPNLPGGESRSLSMASAADLICLDRSLDEACEDLSAVKVRSTWIAGVQVHGSG